MAAKKARFTFEIDIKKPAQGRFFSYDITTADGYFSFQKASFVISLMVIIVLASS